MIGVTGTNGKTSITHFIAQTMHAGVIGTIGYGFPNHLHKTPNTTPGAIQLQKIAAELISQGAEAIAMEVSSHALDQQRVRDMQFAIAVFTNLTQDHLDYHGTMEKYRDAKELLFQQPGLKNAVINIDDDAGKYFTAKYRVTSFEKGGRVLRSKTGGILNVLTYSMHNHSADIYVEKCVPTEHGFDLSIHSPWGNGDCHLPLIGEFNIYNALAVLGVLCILYSQKPSVSAGEVLEKLSHLHTVPGRMQLLETKNKNAPHVVIDYAHTPDALEKALQSVRAHCKGKLICVFGCGGNRDKTKRPIMGMLAEKLSDRVIITNDNPRHEDPEIIAREILAGTGEGSGIRDQGSVRCVIELDRAKAITSAIQFADQNDWILIAGKGHETEQIIGDTTFHHDDRECAMSFLKSK